MVINIIAILLAIAGLVGCILPVLPGPPISWGALLLLYFFGNGAAKCKSVLTHENAVFLPSDDHSVCIDEIVPDAAWMPEGKVVDTAYWEPFYLKAYEAKKSTNIIK